MIQFEEKLRTSALRLADQDNRRMHVPQNPLKQKKTYWGWVATPAAAVAGLIFGMSVHLFMNSESDSPLAQGTDTIRIFQPVHDTLYLTQIVEKERVIEKHVPARKVTASEIKDSYSQPEECTSVQCDGINYSILASK